MMSSFHYPIIRNIERNLVFVTALLLWLTASTVASAEQPGEHATSPPPIPQILILGDSLSAAYGLERDEGWVELLRQKLSASGYSHKVFNASVSGETTTGGLRRLPLLLTRHSPGLVIVELGANDGLRGQSLKAMRQNLRAIISESKAAQARVLLLGMYIPSNYGRHYVKKFHAIYGELAAEFNVGIVNFMLEPIAMDEKNFLKDRIHPNAAAQPILLKHLWPAIQNMIMTQTHTTDVSVTNEH